MTRDKNIKFRPEDVKLIVGGRVIKVKKTARFFGVIFDREISWAPHVNQVIARYRRLNLMKVRSIGCRQKCTTVGVQSIGIYDHVIDSGCIAYDSASVSETVKASLDNVVDLSVFTH